nr:hypothetical protein [bacterium]
MTKKGRKTVCIWLGIVAALGLIIAGVVVRDNRYRFDWLTPADEEQQAVLDQTLGDGFALFTAPDQLPQDVQSLAPYDEGFFAAHDLIMVPFFYNRMSEGYKIRKITLAGTTLDIRVDELWDCGAINDVGWGWQRYMLIQTPKGKYAKALSADVTAKGYACLSLPFIRLPE